MSENGRKEFITYMCADDLLERARRERELLASIWGGLSEVEMVQRPGPQVDWSVKDIIAHITWWEQTMVNWVSRALSDELFTRTETTEELNTRIYMDNRDLPLDTVLEAFDKSFASVEGLLLRMDDEQINDADVCNIRDMPLLYFLIGNTFGHYADHISDLKAYVDRLRGRA